jgi:hypothetical protein
VPEGIKRLCDNPSYSAGVHLRSDRTSAPADDIAAGGMAAERTRLMAGLDWLEKQANQLRNATCNP